MRLLDLTLSTPEENLALDEACLDAVDAADQPFEMLRLWEPAAPLVVVGRGSRVESETRVDRCQATGTPILRRSSGGAAIVTGPGCLMYAVVLSYELRPELRAIDAVHSLVLETLIAALSPLAPGVARRGTSDLALVDVALSDSTISNADTPPRKFSGNSLRCKRRALLYHGTLLYDFPLALVGELLATPPRQPEYRAARDHDAFIANLPLTAGALRAALIAAWDAHEAWSDPPCETARLLARDKYGTAEWNLRW